MAGMWWRGWEWLGGCGGTRSRRPFLLIAALMLACALAACGAAQPTFSASLPGGTYSSAQYHFSIVYPAGWLANVAPEPSPVPGTTLAIPLTLVITRGGETQDTVDLVSNLTVAVINASDPTIAPSVAALAKSTTEQHTTIGGLPAYADAPMTQQVRGSSGVTDTHSAYYVIANGYEYQITSDALSSDAAAPTIAQMLASFQITK